MIPKINVVNGKKVDKKEEVKEQISTTDLTDNHCGKGSDYLLSNVQIRDYIDEVMSKEEHE